MADERADRDVPSTEPTVAAGGHIAYGPDHSFTLQLVGETREAIGGLKSSVDALVIEVKEQRDTMKWVLRVLWFSGGAVLVAGTVVGFALNTGIDKFIKIIEVLAKT